MSASIVETVDFPAPMPPVNPTLIMGEACQPLPASASCGRIVVGVAALHLPRGPDTPHGWSSPLPGWAMIVR